MQRENENQAERRFGDLTRMGNGEPWSMKTLKQLCMPRQSVFDRSRRDVVLDLTDLIAREGHIDPHEFFEENYFTDGMKRLLREAFRRFERQSAQGAFVLSQAMGVGRRTI
jgi:hypothetical protein